MADDVIRRVRRVLTTALLLVLAWGGLRVVRGEGDDTAALLEKAKARFDAGAPREAVSLLEAALEQVEKAGDDPAKDIEVSTRLGAAWVAAGEPYAALQYYERVASERGDPEDHARLAETLLEVARAHLAAGRTGGLEVTPYLLDAAAEAAKIEGEGALLGRRRLVEGEVHWWRGESDAAVKSLDGIPQGALDAPRTTRAAEIRAQALYALGRFPDAARAFAAAGNTRGEASAWAAAKDPKETAAAYGRLLADQKRIDPARLQDAVRGARYASAQGPLLQALAGIEAATPEEQAALGVARARLLADVARTDEAVALLHEAAKDDPTSTAPWIELGRVLLPTGKHGEGADAAVEAWVHALEIDPADPEATSLLWDLAGRDYASAWSSPASLARSLKAQRAIAEAKKDDGLAWSNYGNTLRIAGRLDDALSVYDRAVELEPDDPAIVSDRGLTLAALGRRDDALAAFTASAEYDPAFDSPRQNAARLCWLAGDDAGATRWLSEALRSTRAVGSGADRYRFLLDRVWRTHDHPAWR